MYNIETLPPGLAAPQPENPQTVTFTRLTVPAVSHDRIEKGDVLEIAIAAGLRAEDTATMSARVGESGEIDLASIGNIGVAGMVLPEAESAISAVCVQRGLYRNPHVTVTVKEQRRNRVTVVGAVAKPGVYQIPRGNCDLVAALVAAGSLTKDAGANVEIRLPQQRNNVRLASGVSAGTPRVIKVDLVKASQTRAGGHRLPDGAVISVEQRDPKPIHVIGRVRKPGRFEMPIGKELRLLDAVALAEGVDSKAANTVFVVRRYPDATKPSVIQLSLKDAKLDGRSNLRLAPGDIVSVEQTTGTIFLDAMNMIRFGVSANPFGAF